MEKRLSKTQKFLLAVLNGMKDFHTTLYYPGLVLRFGLEGAEEYLDRVHKKWPYTVSRLKKNRLLEISRKGYGVTHKLTKDGCVAALLIFMKCIDAKLPRKQMLFVTFDIPEKARPARDMFRNVLKQCGFKYFQRSIWYSTIDLERPLNKLIKLLGISKWAHAFVSTEL